MKTLIVVGAAAVGIALSPSANAQWGHERNRVVVSISSCASAHFIPTNNERWAYDPYCRSYFDRVSNRYYDHSNRRYHSSAPARYVRAHYPTGYRHGQVIPCPNSLPAHHVDPHRNLSGRHRANLRAVDPLKESYKRLVERENAQFEAMLDRRNKTFLARKAAETRRFKGRRRSEAEKQGFVHYWAREEQRLRAENDRLKVNHKRHVDALLRDYRNRSIR
ncbi:MAG: hypothetical protein ACON5N_07775 [Akkermansiaceae bacterium]